MTAFRPGQSPPPVRIPMLLFSTLADTLKSYDNLWGSQRKISNQFMKVAIQRPVEDPLGRQISYVNSVFEVEFAEPPPSKGGWGILSSAKELDEQYTPGMPILHKGYFDTHLHMTWAGLYSEGVRLEGLKSAEEVCAKVGAKISATEEILRGYGWDESRLGLKLDALESKFKGTLPESIPIVLYRVCGHSALVNQKLWNLLGKASGPTFITDKVLSGIQKLLPQPNLEECKKAFLKAQDLMISQGISSVGDMSLDETTVTAIRQLAEEGKLMIDVMGVFDAGQAPSVQNHGPLLVKNSMVRGPLDRQAVLSVRHWKKYLDGSFGSRTAWLTESYKDAESFGDSLEKFDELLESSRDAVAAGFHLSFHCIGDAALDQALKVGEQLHRVMESRRLSDSSYDLPKTRHRIEHGQLIRQDQVQKLADQNFWAVCAQPHHRVADSAFIQARLGARRCLEQAYIAASLLKAGVPVTLSSDAPIDDSSPEAAIQAACTHENIKERLRLEDAVWEFTTGARLQLGLEAGRLGPGATVFLRN